VFPRASDRQETRAVPVGHDLLSEREREVLTQLAAGRSNRDIAAALHLSPDTVKTHVARILRKLGASNRAEAVGRWLAMQAR
jgi:DNA-binding NarL/FixJ family response regulator